ncbi:hypothetical protein Arad_7234 [Rhizobium rhizogenes K84]|uniref:Uncharacterized protein n=1 Tax=Rhizobium rhizogenes (strain K84 / ATCC BAA-868) TaxID=311403 RepID=B9JM67_RHIR8|nr:hypothetical protein Arad_7234 [Rhizobium rhizogenes K84]
MILFPSSGFIANSPSHEVGPREHGMRFFIPFFSNHAGEETMRQIENADATYRVRRWEY